MRWAELVMFAGLVACTSGPKADGDTDAPSDSDAADTDESSETGLATDTDVFDDTDAADTDAADTDPGVYLGPIGSCDFHVGYCQEYWTDLTTMAVYQDSCADNSGTWADAACSHTGVIGGCRDSSSGWITLTNWFNADSGYADAHAVRTACQASASTYVAP